MKVFEKEELINNIKEGEKAVDFSINKEQSLFDLKGDVIFLIFWKSL
ncbi:MAG: hypothetical protein HY999_00390 [Nitrospinae bacterium]|nr:hypothetical protein [Nitrospinota bacterium]